MAFKMKGHTLPGINQKGYNSAKDGKAKSAAFQHDDGTEHSHETKMAKLENRMGKKTREEIEQEEEIARQAAIDAQGLRDQAISRGAYGGGREGVMAAEQLRGSQMNRANLQAQLLNQGFQQAQAAAQADMQARQGLGTYQSQLGQQQQGFEQAKLDAAQIAAREKEFAPFTQLGLVGQQLAQIQPGAFPTQTVGYAPPAAPASPMSQFLGAGAGIGGMMGKLGLFG